MNSKENQEIIERLKNLKDGMLDYLKTGEPEYTASDVEKCITLINAFLDEISKSDTKENGMKSVENVILKLNELNDNCDNELIETDQREDIANIIIIAGYLKGYNGKKEDITEEWREW